MASFWKKLSRYAAGGAAAMLLSTGAARAEESAADLKARIEAQDKKIEHLQRIIESGGLRPINTASEADREAIKSIVDDYLKQPKPGEGPKEPEWLEVGKDTSFSTKFSNGFHWATKDGAFKGAIRGRAQFDTGFAGNTNDAALGGSLDDGMLFRRLRLGVQGTIWEQFDYVVEVDFASSSDIAFRDVFVGMHDLPLIGNFVAGHRKEFYSLEQLTSSKYLTFIERSINDDAFAEGRNPGFFAYRNFGPDDRIFVGGSLTTTASDNGSHAFTKDRWNYGGRIAALPVWYNEGRCLVHIGASAQSKQFNGDVTTSATSPGTQIRRFRSRPYRVDPHAFIDAGNIFSDDGWGLYGLEAAAVFGPLSIQGEFMYANIENARIASAAGAQLGNVDYNGFYVYASYYLTGENRNYDRKSASFGRPSVNEPFFLVRGEDGCTHRGLGAWEIAARYGYLDLNDSSGAARAGRLYQYTLGLNWYWNRNMKIQWNYEWFNKNRTGGDFDAQTFVMRVALDF